MRAEDEYGDSEPTEDPDWISWFDVAELNGETGTALALLAVHHEQLRDQAADRLTAAARTHGTGQQRSTALAWSRLAAIHAACHDPRQAAYAAQQALDIIERLRSPRVIEELVNLRPQIQPLADHPDVADVAKRISALAIQDDR